MYCNYFNIYSVLAQIGTWHVLSECHTNMILYAHAGQNSELC